MWTHPHKNRQAQNRIFWSYINNNIVYVIHNHIEYAFTYIRIYLYPYRNHKPVPSTINTLQQHNPPPHPLTTNKQNNPQHQTLNNKTNKNFFTIYVFIFLVDQLSNSYLILDVLIKQQSKSQNPDFF